MLPSLCSDWAFSAYFTQPDEIGKEILISRAQNLNHKYYLTAQHYINQLDSRTKQGHEVMLQSEADITIGVITVHREAKTHVTPGYLTQTLAKLDELIKLDNNFRIALFVCDVSAPHQLHIEATNMSFYFPTYRGLSLHDGHSSFEKEKRDYICCLEKAMQTRSKYIMMVEDDAVPRDKLFDTLHYLLHMHPKLATKPSVPDPWAYLKLYYPVRWRGFGMEINEITDLISLAVLGGCFWLFAYKMLNFSTRGFELVVFVIGMLYTVVLVYTVGRQYFLDFLRISKDIHRVIPAPECCTPSILFPVDKVEEVVSYLRTQSCTEKYPIDLALENFVKSKHYHRWLVEPNLFTHIGMVSSMKSGMRFPEEFIYR